MFNRWQQHTLITAALLATVATRATAQRVSGNESLDERVAQALAQSNVPGAIVAVVSADSIVIVRAFGRARLGADGPMDTTALFQVGLVTELINGLAAAVLASTGKLKLDGPLGGAFPELPSQLRRVTVAQLLSPTAGVAYQPAVPGRGGANNLGAAARQLTYLDVFTEPGTIHSYSMSGASLAALAIERAAGVPYTQAIRETVLRPLGMESATLDFQTARPRIAPGFVLSTNAATPVVAFDYEPVITLAIPRRGLFASIHDLARLSAALLSNGRISGRQVLPQDVITAVLTPRTTVPGGADEFGLGVQVTRFQGRREIQLAGGGGGHGYLVRLLPDQKLGVIVLTNLGGTPLYSVSEYVLQRMFGLPAVTRARSDAPARKLSDFIGTYRNGGEEVELRAEGEKVRLRSDDARRDGSLRRARGKRC
jgi:CubicO group peptidase (beta-lactamase class C family)